MPRIRSLKPEHKQHRKVGPLSDFCYRLWVGCILEADDDGRFVADATGLRVTTFSYHPTVTSEMVAEGLRMLHEARLIRLYSSHKTLYAWFPSWADHQRIHKRHYTPSRLPPPPTRSYEARVHGTSTVPVPDESGTSPVGSEGSDQDRKGSDRKGEEWRGKPDVSHVTGSNGNRPTGWTEEVGDETLARALKLTVDDVRRQRAEARQRTP